MSEATWIKEFYPVPTDQVPEKKAIQHSLVKWYGLRKENLAKHGIYDPPISIRDDSCALCVTYIDSKTTEILRCAFCPLREFLGKSCDGWNDAPYFHWNDELNPEPMIAALEAIAFVEKVCK